MRATGQRDGNQRGLDTRFNRWDAARAELPSTRSLREVGNQLDDVRRPASRAGDLRR